jgi:hypothetical protein
MKNFENPYTWEAEEGGLWIWGQASYMVKSYLKKQSKWTGGVVQVVKHLLSECEAVSSNPILPKNSPRQKKTSTCSFKYQNNYLQKNVIWYSQYDKIIEM